MTGEIFEIIGRTVKEIGKAGTRVNHLVYLKDYRYTPNSIDIWADGKTIYVLDFNTGDVRTLTSGQGA